MEKILELLSLKTSFSVAFADKIWPFFGAKKKKDGIFLPNMVAAFSYGLGVCMAVTFILLLRISSFVDPLNKNLKDTWR